MTLYWTEKENENEDGGRGGEKQQQQASPGGLALADSGRSMSGCSGSLPSHADPLTPTGTYTCDKNVWC